MTVASLAVGLAGNVTGVLLYASPIPIFWRILKRRSTESFSGIPYVFAALSTLQWAYFGLLRGHQARPLLSLTVIGFALQFTFNSIYLRFASKSQRVVQAVSLTVAACWFVGMVAITMQLLSGRMRANTVGIVCAVNSIIFSISPMLILRRVIKTSSVEFMPFYLPLFMFLSGAIWAVFAFLTQDAIVAVPNCINFVSGGIQITLYGYYKLTWRSSTSSTTSNDDTSIGNEDINSTSDGNNQFMTNNNKTLETSKSIELTQITCMS